MSNAGPVATGSRNLMLPAVHRGGGFVATSNTLLKGSKGAADSPDPRVRVAFVFPILSGHVNPALALVRGLVERSAIEVHFLAEDSLKEAAEFAGATFHDAKQWEPEFFDSGDSKENEMDCARRHLKASGVSDLFGAQVDMFNRRRFEQRLMGAKRSPGAVNFLRHVKASAVVFDPLWNFEAAVAARHLRIPAISLLTVAGPGAIESLFTKDAMNWFRENAHLLQPYVNAVEEMNETYSLQPPVQLVERSPFVGGYGDVAIVTTLESLADPTSDFLKASLAEAGCSVMYVGPLIDATTQIGPNCSMFRQGGSTPSEDSMIRKIRAAKAKGARIVYASLGTVLTGNAPDRGWNHRPSFHDWATNMTKEAISGKELCQSAWRAVFETFGSEDSTTGKWFIVVSTGQQPDALDGIPVPPNAWCDKAIPQVELFKEGIDLFLTHGGQNSFMEGLSCGIPMVVCPGFGDQPVNAGRAEQLGVGLKVDRAARGAEGQYQRAVVEALQKVTGTQGGFAEASARMAKMFVDAPSIDGAISIILDQTIKAREPMAGWST